MKSSTTEAKIKKRKKKKKKDVIFGEDGKFHFSQSHKAASQLLIHVTKLHKELGVNLERLEKNHSSDRETSRVKLCVCFPRFEAADGAEQFNDKYDALDWETFCEIYHLTPLTEKNIEKPKIHFMNGSVLKSTEKFLAWLKKQLPINSSAPPAGSDQLGAAAPTAERPPASGGPEEEAKSGRVQFYKAAAWCFLHTFGLVLNHLSSVVDRKQEDLCLKGAPNAVSEDTPASNSAVPPKALVALFTPKQMHELLKDDSKKQPRLITGSAGTGKTFLARMKIKQLHSAGRLTAGSRAMVIVKADQTCLRDALKNTLHDYGPLVVVKSVDYSLDDLVRYLNGQLPEDIIPEDIKCVFVDQLEDFFDSSSDIYECTGKLWLKSGKFDVAWFLWNGGLYAKPERQEETAPEIGWCISIRLFARFLT